MIYRIKRKFNFIAGLFCLLVAISILLKVVKLGHASLFELWSFPLMSFLSGMNLSLVEIEKVKSD